MGVKVPLTATRRQRRARHSATCRHCPRVRQLGHDFRVWRASWELTEERATHGYAAERAEYAATRPAPTFRDYLVAMTGAGWPMSGQAPRRWHQRGAAAA